MVFQPRCPHESGTFGRRTPFKDNLRQLLAVTERTVRHHYPVGNGHRRNQRAIESHTVHLDNIVRQHNLAGQGRCHQHGHPTFFSSAYGFVRLLEQHIPGSRKVLVSLGHSQFLQLLQHAEYRHITILKIIIIRRDINIRHICDIRRYVE